MMNRFAQILIMIFCLLVVPCGCMGEDIRLFIGQDLEAIGGMDGYENGYADSFGIPDGITTYTSLPSLDGLFSPANWGSGDVNASAYVASTAFDGVDMAIGLHLVGQTKAISLGLYRASIQRLGQFIMESSRTVYLRIGYEFNGAWNGYPPDEYIAAYRAIVDALRDMGVTNVQYVWQSSGYGSVSELMRWYPGDDYVDLMGYSYFDGPSALIGRGILTLAKAHGKQVFIAEATPKCDVKQGDGEIIWEKWYQPFLDHIQDHADVICAVSYINCDWDRQPMWHGQGWGDSRLQCNPILAQKWCDAWNINDDSIPSSDVRQESLCLPPSI